MTKKRLPAVFVLVAAVAALAASVAWAVGRSDDADRSSGMMRLGPGMMGYAPTAGENPVRGLDDARRQAQRFADRLDLRVGEVMRFTNGYYAELVESDGRGATEVLVNPSTGAVWLEYGPAMMWNARYGMMAGSSLSGPGEMMDGAGMMGGMMGGNGMMGGDSFADPTLPPAWDAMREPGISAGQAERLAQHWLDERRAGFRAAEAEAFPGYYTLHALRDGRVAGMLSVNASSGAVWYHWWHGRFVAMAA
jgi:Spy/CpxP family protein refolding chaperone